MQATQKRKAASKNAQAANITPMINATIVRLNIQQIRSMQEKIKPTRAAKILGAASIMAGLILKADVTQREFVVAHEKRNELLSGRAWT